MLQECLTTSVCRGSRAGAAPELSLVTRMIWQSAGVLPPVASMPPSGLSASAWMPQLLYPPPPPAAPAAAVGAAAGAPRPLSCAPTASLAAAPCAGCGRTGVAGSLTSHTCIIMDMCGPWYAR